MSWQCCTPPVIHRAVAASTMSPRVWSSAATRCSVVGRGRPGEASVTSRPSCGRSARCCWLSPITRWCTLATATAPRSAPSARACSPAPSSLASDAPRNGKREASADASLFVELLQTEHLKGADGTSFGETLSRGWRGFARRSSPKAVSGQPPPESHELYLSSFGPPPLSGATIQTFDVSVGKSLPGWPAAIEIATGELTQTLAPEARIVAGMHHRDGEGEQAIHRRGSSRGSTIRATDPVVDRRRSHHPRTAFRCAVPHSPIEPGEWPGRWITSKQRSPRSISSPSSMCRTWATGSW